MKSGVERSQIFAAILVLVLASLFVVELPPLRGALPAWASASCSLVALALLGLLLFEHRKSLQVLKASEERISRAQEVSEEKFALVFRAIPDAVMITSLPTGDILEVNEGFTRLSGYSREEALGRTVLDLKLWADLEERAQVLRMVEQRGALRDMELKCRRKSGDLVTCVLSLVKIELKETPALLSVLRDISSLKRVQEAKDTLYNELMATNHELERFTYTVSHDLKSPLFTIRGFLGLLEKDIASGDQKRVAGDIERIQTAAESMERLLGDLLKLSRAGRVVDTVGIVSPVALVQEAAEMLAGELGDRGVALEFEDTLPMVVGDHQRLIQVFLNLIGNAIKFMGEQTAPKIWITAAHRGPLVECVVRDNGRGIEPRDHEIIFGLFKRLDHKNRGTGIGLALVKRIIEVHGGGIWVESEGEGKGSAFHFTLPAESPVKE